MTAVLQPEIENALEDLLHRETSELAQFIHLLEEELDALASGQADTVQQCASRKQGMLGRIFATRDAVNTVARRASSNPALKSAESWLARTPSIRIRQAFDELTDHAEYARQLNQLAGRLVQIKLRNVNDRLGVLQPAGLMQAVYYAQGYSAAQMSSKGTVGRA
jgi:flagellar biosynthesis/type III secretory pathway chaperone